MNTDKFTNDNYVVYTRRLAYELRCRGFKIVDYVPDRNKPYFDNYLFKDTPELRAAIAEINAERKSSN